MHQKVITPPNKEPITLDEAKEHLRVIQSNEDALIESLITAAREYCEDFQNRSYYTQTRQISFDKRQYDIIKLPRPPLQSIDKFVLVDTEDTEHEVTDYTLDDGSEPARLLVNNYPTVDELKSIGGVKIQYTCGHQTIEEISEKVKAAIKLLIGHWYTHREAVETQGSIPKTLELAVDSLLSQNRVVPV